MRVKSLEKKLRDTIEGEILFGAGSLALYATDASNYRQIPVGIIRPKNLEAVIRTVQICREFEMPILNRGAGTSLAGQCCNAAIILDFSKYLNRILEIDAKRKTARVEPGIVLDTLQNALRPHGLIFGPDPATHNRCTLGGMIGNNACGAHSVMAGKTADNIEELEILTYDGLRMKAGPLNENELETLSREDSPRGIIYSKLKTIRDRYSPLISARYPAIPRRVSGYNLDALLPSQGFHLAKALTGSEGTCVTFLSATLKLMSNPPARALIVLGYRDVFEAADAVPEILVHKPIAVEGLDENYIRRMKKRALNLKEISLLPEGNGWLIAEFAGNTQEEAESRAQTALKGLNRHAASLQAKLFADARRQKLIWAVRESTFGSSVFVPGEKDTYAGFEDSAVAPEKLGRYLRELQKLYDKHGYDSITYGHFGDGCVHTRLSFDLRTEKGILQYRAFVAEAAELVSRYGGSLSGEHGDGQNWGEFLPLMYGEELVEAFREFKTVWDPRNRMNPGKLIDACRCDENLRLKNYKTLKQPKLHFTFQEDGGNFSRTTERCIGIAKCLKTDEGVMCPSYMATREEKYSTRGRARLLHEMLRGEILKGGWRDPDVKEAMETCLACKACRSECPVSVDVATYRAEFLSHYYRNRVRPLSAYVFGYLHWGCAIAKRMPRLANFLTQTPGLSRLIKSAFGIAPQRNLPVFAPETFRSWFFKRPLRNATGPKMMLWTDLYNDCFTPKVLKSACAVLETAGFRVTIPEKPLHAGRPFYDQGMLSAAKRTLEKILRHLAARIEKEMPIVVLEPSDASVFRDEMLHFFPQNENARRLAGRIFLFAEFLEKHAPLLAFRPTSQKAVVLGHCHQKSLSGTEADSRILSRSGLDFEILDSSCCGMAGAFGFKKETYAISMQVAEKTLFPALRKADQSTWILADGFSCREQVKAAGRSAIHLAEALHRLL